MGARKDYQRTGAGPRAPKGRTGLLGQLGRWAAVAAVAAGTWLGFARDAKADAGDTVYWKNNTSYTNWNADAWYNTTRSWDDHNPNYCGHQRLFFDNDNQLKTYNNFSGNGLAFWQLIYTNGVTKTHTAYGSASTAAIFYDWSGTNPKIENYVSTEQRVLFLCQIGAGKTLEVNPVGGDLSLSKIYVAGQIMNVYGDHKLTINDWYAGTNSANAPSTIYVANAAHVVVTNWRAGTSSSHPLQTVNVVSSGGQVDIQQVSGLSHWVKQGSGKMVYGGNAGTSGDAAYITAEAGTLIVSNFTAVASEVTATNMTLTNSATLVMKSPATFRRVSIAQNSVVEMDVLSNSEAAHLGVVPSSENSNHQFNCLDGSHTLKLKYTTGFDPTEDADWIVYVGRRKSASGGSMSATETGRITVDTSDLVSHGATGTFSDPTLCPNSNGAANTAIKITYTALKQQAAVGLATTTFTYNGNTITLTPNGGSGSGAYSMAFVSGGTGTGTFNASTKVLTVTAAGTFLFDVTRAASGAYAARTDRVTVTVNKGTQASVGLSTTTFTYNGSTITLTPNGGSGSGAYSMASVSGGTGTGTFNASTKVLTVTAAGTFKYNVTRAADNLWNSKTDAVTVTVNKGTQAAVGLSTTTFTYAGSGFTLSGNGGSGSGAYSYVYKANGTGSGSVSGSTLTPTAAGTMTVTVTRAADSLWNAKSGDVTVTVNKGTQAAVGLATTTFTYSPSGNTLTGNGGSGSGAFSYTYKAAGTGSGSVAGSTLSVTAVGNMTVTVTKAADSLWNSKSADVLVTVNKASQTVGFTSSPAMVTAGKSTSVAATVTSPATGGGAVTFSGNNDAVATVESGGSVTGVGAGQVTITATAAETDFYAEATATYVLTVRMAGPATSGTITDVTNIGSDTFTVQHTRGDGYYTILFAKTDGAPAVPEDGKGVNGTVTASASSHVRTVAYSAAKDYPYGGASDGTKAIVHSSASNDMNWAVTGASPATHYYLALYTHNPNQNSGSSATNWAYSATGSTRDFWTLSTEPTGNPSLVEPTEAAGTLGSGSATINWTKGTGANNTLVVIYGPADTEAAALALDETAPVDGNVYSGSALDGTVLHAGTGMSAVASGLTKLKWYKVVAYSYALGGDNSTANYLMPGAVITFQTLDSNGPLVWATGVDATSFLLNWTNLVDAANGFAVQVKTDAGTFSSQTDVADESFTTAEGWTAGDPGSSYAANSGTWKFNNCTVQPTSTGMGDTGYVYVSAVGSTVETPLMHDAVSHVEVRWRNGAGGRKVRVDVDRNGDGDYADTGEQGVCVWTNGTTSGCQTNFLYFASPRTSTSGIRIRFYNLGLTGEGSGNTIYIHRVKVGRHRGYSQLVDGLTDGSTYEARVQNAPNASDWSDVLTVKAGVVPTGLATGAVTRGSAAFSWSGANSPTGYRWQATTNAATGWTNQCTDGDTLTGADARSLYTNAFKSGRQWMYIGTTVGNPEHAPGGSVNDTPRYIVHQGGAHYLSGKAGLGIQSTNFPIAGATNIVLSYTIVNWNLGIVNASAEMGRVDAYYRLDDGPWCYLGTGLNPNSGDGQTLAQTFTLDKGYLDGTNIAFKVVAPNAGHGTYSGADRLVGPGIQALEVKAQGGLGDYTTLFAEGTDSGSATVDGLDGNCPVYFRVQALQGSSVRSVWVETESRTSNLLGPTPSVEGTGRHEVTASWAAYDGEDAGDYNISYKVQLTGCASGGEPEEVSACPASGRAYGSSTTDWTYQRAYSGGTASSYPSWSSPWHRLWGQFASTTVYPGLESPEMDLTGYEKGYVEFSHNYINQKTNSEVALYWKIGDGGWTKWADTPRAQYSSAANATKRNIELPDEVIGQTRVKVKLVAWKAVNYDSDPDPEVTSYMVQGASVFGARVMAQGAGGGKYDCDYTSDEYTTTGTSYTFNAETLAGDSHLTGLMAGSNYYVHVQTVLTPKAGGAATTSEWSEDGNGTTAAPQLPPAEVWVDEARQQHLTVAWDAADGADENTQYRVQVSSCQDSTWTSVGVQPSATNADLTVDDDWQYVGGGSDVTAGQKTYITGRDEYPAYAGGVEMSQVLAGDNSPGLESVEFSTVGASWAKVTFGHGRWYNQTDLSSAPITVSYSTDGGESWTDISTTTYNDVPQYATKTREIDLPDAALGKSRVKVRLEARSAGFRSSDSEPVGCAVRNATVTMGGAVGDYDTCLVRDVAGLSYDQLSLTLGDLTNNTTYYFRVAASDGTQYGGWVNGMGKTLAPPSAPDTAPWATAIGRHTMTIQWVAGEGAETYTLEVYTNAALSVLQERFEGVVGTEQKVTGLDPNKTYWFRVRSHADGTDSTGWSATGNAKTVTDVSVTGLHAEDILETSMTLKWDYVDGTTYTLHWGPTTTNGATDSREERIECPAKTLERSDAGNGWFYLGGNGDYPAYWTSSGNPVNDQGHALIYATGGKPAMQSRWFSTYGATNATVEFLHGRFNAGADSTVLVQYSVDGGASWATAGTADSTAATNPSVARAILLPQAALGRRSVAVRLTATGATGTKGAHLKDVQVVVRSGSTGAGTEVLNAALGSTGSYPLTGLTKGTRYWFEMTASEAGDTAAAETTAATRTKTTGALRSQGFEGMSTPYGVLDTTAWGYTIKYNDVGTDTWRAEGSRLATDPKVEVVADENPLYGDRALRMSGSTNAAAFGVVEFDNVSLGAGGAASVTVPFASRNLGSGENLWFSYSTDNGWSWKAPVAKTIRTNGWQMAKIGVGGSDVINQNWPYNHGSNTTTRPQGDAYVFETNGITQLKIRIAFCGNARSADHYYYLDGVTVKRLPGTPTGATAVAQEDGSMLLGWTPPAGQSVVILRGRDERHVPQSPIDLDNLPSGYELVTQADGSPYFANGTTTFYDREVTSGWKYYYYFYGAMSNGDGTYSLSTECATAHDVVKGMVTTIASQGWDGWDVHPWGYKKGRVTNPGARSDGGWWKTNGMNNVDVAFLESWETDARDSTGPSGQYYADYYGTGLGATDADRTNQLGITSKTNYYGDHSFRLSGGGSYWWAAGNLSINTNNAAVQFDNVDLSGYKNVQFSMHIAATNLGLGGDDLHVAISTNGGTDWVAVSSTNAAKWAVVPSSLDYGLEVIDGNHGNGGDWDFYFESFEPVEYTYNGNPATSIPTPEGNPYVLHVPDSVTQMMVRVMFYDSNGGSKRKMSYFIDEVRLTGDVALETPHPTMENITSNGFVVAWDPIEGASTYDVRVTKCEATGDDAVLRTESFVLNLVTNGWTTNVSGSATLSSGATYNHTGSSGYGLIMGGNGTELTSPEIGAMRQVSFWGKTSGANSNSKLLVQVSEDGTHWETVTNYVAAGNVTPTATQIASGSWVQKTVDLPHRQWARVRFLMQRNESAAGNFYIDDIRILGGGDYDADGCMVKEVTGVTGTSQGFTNGVGGMTILPGTNYFVEVKAHGTLAGNPTHSSWGETGDYTTGDFAIRPDGFEMVRMTWAAASGGILVMAVPEGDDFSDVSAPTNTTVGGINGKGVVLANTTSAKTGAGFEHVRPYGSRTEDYEAKYVVYWKHGSYWEGRLETSVTLPTYPGVAEDTFAVTNLTTGANLGTYSADEGKGWSGGWSVWDDAASKVSVTTGTAMVTGTYTNYGLLGTNRLVGAGGNMIHFNMNSDTMTARVCRVLSSALSTEEVWIMATMRSQYGTEAAHEDKMFGVQLFSSAETLSASIFATVGKMKWLYGGKPRLGIDKGVSGSMPPGDVTWSGEAGDYTYNMTDTGHEGSKGSHTLVMKYEPAKGDLYVAAFSNVATHASGGALRPDKAAKPTTWAVYKQGVADDNTPLAGVILFGYGYHGALDFDEVRVGSSWDEIVGVQTEPPQNVAAAQAWTDGNELVRIAWQYAGGLTNAGVVHPLADGVKIYAKEGTGEGEWFEIYKGKGTNTVVAKDAWSRWDHVVAPGSTHEYKVVAYASSKYTNGVVAVNRDASPDTAVTTGLYGDTEYVNPFAYTNWAVANTNAGYRWMGGNGFGANYWAPGDGSAGTWSIATPEEAQAAVHITNGVYGSRPAAGNVLKVEVGNNETASINRTLDGDAWYGKGGQTFYVAFRMAYRWGNEGGRQVGLRLTDSDGKYVQFGKGRGDDAGWKNRFGVTASPNGTGYTSGWSTSGDDMLDYGSNGVTRAYLVVGKVNWSSDGKANLRGVKYVIGTNGTPATLPGSESDVSWEASYDNAGIGAIRKIELIAGTAAAGEKVPVGTIGTAWFDEIRFGPKWEDIVGATEPEDTWVDGIGVVGEGGTDATYRYLGDYVQWYMYGWPKGPKQSAWVTLATDNTFATVLATNGTSWVTNIVDNRDGTGRLQTKWQGGEVQFTRTDNVYAGGSVKGELVTLHSWQRPEPYASYGHKWNVYNVRALPHPVTNATSAVGGTAKVTLRWSPATENGRTFTEVMVVRYTGDGAAPAPVQGTTYLKGQRIGSGTVVYRGTATNLVDKGLNKNTTFHYQFFTVNNSYYSVAETADATTDENDPEILIDGDPTDWVGEPSETKNSSTLSSGEWIWTDKVLDGRVDKDAAYDADITEFRMKVDTNKYVNFMVRLHCMTNKQNPYISVGIVTNVDATTNYLSVTNADGENWIGDESATFMGGNLFEPASLHYADIQMAVHWVTTAGEDGEATGSGGWVVELYRKDRNSWFAPVAAWEAESSTNGAADACIEWKVKRSDLGLDYATVTPARFTVASFANGGGWNNDTQATVDLSSGTSHAVDTLSIAPWGVNDKNLSLGAWDEGIKNGNAEYWFDIWFGPTALHNAAPNAPETYTLDGNAAYNGQLVSASPTMRWNACTDATNNGCGFVVGYLVEVSTNEYFSGLEGTTENGPISCRVNVKSVEGEAMMSYRYKTDSRYYWWRVRARDNTGALSAPTPWSYEVTGKTDNEGPEARLLFVGKDAEVAQYVSNPAFRHEADMSGDATSVLDSDLEDGGHTFGFVIEWYDVNGVFATNWMRAWQEGDGDGVWPSGSIYPNSPWRARTGGVPHAGDFAWNIQSHHGDGTPYGRVSPNWDLIIVDRSTVGKDSPTKANESVSGTNYPYVARTNLVLPTDDGGTETLEKVWIIDCGLDHVFQPAEMINDGNDGQYITNHIQGAFAIGSYRTDLDIYLTVSAEDSCRSGPYAETADYDWPLASTNGTGSYQAQSGVAGYQQSGFCAAAPNPSRNVTTNQLLHIHVRDNDTVPPVASQAKWRTDATGAGGKVLLPMMAVTSGGDADAPGSWDPTWDNLAAQGRVPTQDGQGKALEWQLTDGDVSSYTPPATAGGAGTQSWKGSAKPIRLFFNVYDEYLHSGLASFTGYNASNVPPTKTDGAAMTGSYVSQAAKTRTLYNTLLMLGSQTNVAGYRPAWSKITQYPWEDDGENTHGWGTGPDTVLAWQLDASEANVTNLFGRHDILSALGSGFDTNGAIVFTNDVKLLAWDNDNNAEGDQEGEELTFGRVLFSDDDATAPEMPGFSAYGTGTNYTWFGILAKWTWATNESSGGVPVCTVTDKRWNIQTSTNVFGKKSSTSRTPESDSPEEVKWNSTKNLVYMQGNMNATEYRAANSRYFQFEVGGNGDTTWRSDMIGFWSRVSPTGPTKFTLTVQGTAGISYPAASGTGGTATWALDANDERYWTTDYCTVTNTKVTSHDRVVVFRKNGNAAATAYLESKTLDCSSIANLTIDFDAAYCGGTSEDRKLKVQYLTSDDAAGDWHTVKTFNSTKGEGENNFPAPASDAAGWKHYSYNFAGIDGLLQTPKTVKIRLYANALTDGNGFYASELKLTAGGDESSERWLGDIVIEKQIATNTVTTAGEEQEAGSYANTETSVILGFDGLVEGYDNSMQTFRLYGYGATHLNADTGEIDTSNTSQGTWGIKDLFIHGTASEVTPNLVTDYDITRGTWTNQLEAVDGAMGGYDTLQSGLRMFDATNAAGAKTEVTGEAPAFRILYPTYYNGTTQPYPNGTSETVTDGDMVLEAVAKASYSKIGDPDFEAAEGWSLANGASIAGGVLTLPNNDAVSSASRVFTVTPPEDLAGVTFAGTISAKATTKPADGGTNTLWVTVQPCSDNAGATTIGDPLVEELTLTTYQRWKNYAVGPWPKDLTSVRSVVVSVAQSNATSTELLVDSLDVYVAQWGTEITTNAADAAAWAANVTNGMPGARIVMGTPTNDLSTTPVPIISETLIGTLNRYYRLEATLHDYDKDRPGDSLGASAVTNFWLYDDDRDGPQFGSKYGGPLGVFLNDAIIPQAWRTGITEGDDNSRLNQRWPIVDSELTSLAQDDPVKFALSFYDYSGWWVSNMILGELTLIENGNVSSAAAEDGWTAPAENDGAADSPGAMSYWTIGAKALYDEYKESFDDTSSDTGEEMKALVWDKDRDRAADALSFDNAGAAKRVGYVWFTDQDVTEPAWGSQADLYSGIMISTNVPNTAEGYTALTNQTDADAPYAVGGLANNKMTTTVDGKTVPNFAGRSYVIYDGELHTNVASSSQFVITANINDPADGYRAHKAAGLQRGSTLTNKLAMWGDDPASPADAANVFIITNTYVVLTNASAGTALTNAAYNSVFSEPVSKTRVALQAGHTSWTWSNFHTNDIGLMLPAGETESSVGVVIEAFDADLNRHNDQKHVTLSGPTITLKDDDTKEPGQPGVVSLTGLVVPTETLVRTNAPWTNNLSGVKMSFGAAGDPLKVGDLNASGVARYRLAAPGTTIAVGVGDVVVPDEDVVVETAETRYSEISVPNLTASQQGWGEYRLFAEDKDDDRPADALAGTWRGVPLAYDITKPTKVALIGHGTGASTDDVDDPTTQMDIKWSTTNVGPDDPVEDKTNYDAIPSTYKSAAGATKYNVLSPWETYKVYYRTYNAAEVAQQTDQAGYVYDTYVSNGKYKGEGWTNVTKTNSIIDPSHGTNDYSAMGTLASTQVRLFDLEFDQDYLFVIVGVDKAGNEGPADTSSWATNNTFKFAVTQGVIRTSFQINSNLPTAGSPAYADIGMARITDTNVTKAAVLYWLAAGQDAKTGTFKPGGVTKQYDLIYRDAKSFNELGNETWYMAGSAASTNSGTSKTNWNYQVDPDLDKPNRLRFYRASYHDRWQDTKPGSSEKQFPLASEEVYSMNNIVLSEGFNYVSLQGVPWTNTFEGVFGTDTEMWPCGISATDTNSTQVQFFTATNGELVAEWYYFGGDGEWYDSNMNKVTTNNQAAGFFMRPFSINLPNGEDDEGNPHPWWKTHDEGLGATYGSRSVKSMMWHPIMQVPTNAPSGGFSHTVKRGEGMYNTLSLNLPVSVHPSNLCLVAFDDSTPPKPTSAKMKTGNPWEADQLYVIDSATKEVRGDATMYCDANGEWRYAKGTYPNYPKVTGTPIRPNDILVLISATNGVDWTWTYHPTNFYTPPNRHMGRKPDEKP